MVEAIRSLSAPSRNNEGRDYSRPITGTDMPTEERFRHAQWGRAFKRHPLFEIVRFVMDGNRSSQIVLRFIVSFVFSRNAEIKAGAASGNKVKRPGHHSKRFSPGWLDMAKGRPGGATPAKATASDWTADASGQRTPSPALPGDLTASHARGHQLK